MAPRTDRFEPNPARVAAEIVDDEAILIHLDTGVYYSLDGAGSLLWAQLARRRSLSEIAAAISAAYTVSTEQASADVARIVDALLDEQLITPASQVPAPDDPPAAGKRLPYAAPELHIYRDMSTMLAEDPPMPGLTTVPRYEEHPLP